MSSEKAWCTVRVPVQFSTFSSSEGKLYHYSMQRHPIQLCVTRLGKDHIWGDGQLSTYHTLWPYSALDIVHKNITINPLDSQNYY